MGFLSRGVTIAVLKNGGTDPETRELLTKERMWGPTEGSISFKRWVGTISKLQDVDFIWEMVLRSVAKGIGVREEIEVMGGSWEVMAVVGVDDGGWILGICDLIAWILSVKKVKNDSQWSCEAGTSRVLGAPTTRSIV